MIGTVIKAELKNMVRDKMYLVFAFYPILFGGLGYFLIDYIEERVAQDNLAPEIVAMFLILMTGYIFGALIAFTLLDDKDDLVLMSLKITPISVKSYVIVKLVVAFIFGFIATIIITLATGFLPDATFWSIILISIAGALQAPGLTLIVNSFSRNKVEGFVVMKLSGLLLVLPVIAFFTMEWQEVFLVFAPGFWPARMIQIELLPQFETNFNYITYFIIGVIYNMLFLTMFMKIYAKKSNL
jgi:fluoroquinolone transport system permease protein